MPKNYFTAKTEFTKADELFIMLKIKFPFLYLLLMLLCFFNYLFVLTSCTGKSEKDDGLHTSHFEGTEIVKQTIEYKNGKKNGFMKEYFKNGILKAKQFYRNDTLTDTSFFYYENGRLANYYIIKNNKSNGCWRKYNKSGMLYSEICFNNGLLQGRSTEYTYRSGRVLNRFNYEDGRKHGKQESFYSNGKPKSVTYFHYDAPCIGTEEWIDSGRKIENDFKISINESNQVLLKNTLTFIVKLQNPQPDDIVYETTLKDTGRVVNYIHRLTKVNDHFELEFNLPNGSFIMEKIKIAAYRKTGMGNTVIKTAFFNASANHF